MTGRSRLVAPLRITLLGGFHAEAASGRRIEIAAKKTRALLAYLGLPAGRQHTRDKLADLLWSDRGDKQARASLRQALGELRKAFEALDASPLVLDHDKVALDPAVAEVDVATFVTLAAGEELADLRRAAALYAGDIFDGFDVSDQAYADWLGAERNASAASRCTFSSAFWSGKAARRRSRPDDGCSTSTPWEKTRTER